MYFVSVCICGIQVCDIWNDAGWTIVLYGSTFHEFVLPVFWNHTLTNLLNRTEPPKVLSLLFECSSKVQNVIQVAPMAFGARRRRTWCFRCIIYLTLLFKRWGMSPLEMLNHNSSRRIPCSISNISNRRIGTSIMNSSIRLVLCQSRVELSWLKHKLFKWYMCYCYIRYKLHMFNVFWDTCLTCSIFCQVKDVIHTLDVLVVRDVVNAVVVVVVAWKQVVDAVDVLYALCVIRVSCVLCVVMCWDVLWCVVMCCDVLYVYNCMCCMCSMCFVCFMCFACYQCFTCFICFICFRG